MRKLTASGLAMILFMAVVVSVIAQSGTIMVQDCNGKLSVWTAREEPVCDRWIVQWRHNGKVWGEEMGKTREEVLRKVASHSKSTDPSYSDPGPPLCVACLDQ